MDIDKLFKKAEELIDAAFDKVDGKDANSVWSTTTRVGGTAPGTISRYDLEFLLDAAEDHETPVVRRYVKSLRKKYLGDQGD